MDSFELNKIVGAVLLGLLLFMGIKLSAESLFHVEDPENKGYYVEVAEAAETEVVEVVVEARPSIAELLQTASADAGRQAFRPCQSCHSADPADGHRLGPNLYGIVGAAIASHADFSYSDAMGSDGGTWSFERLNDYLAAPADTIPGNRMVFGGIRRDSARANLIAYLNAQSDNPLALPEVAIEEVVEEAAPEASEAVAGEVVDGEAEALGEQQGGDDAEAEEGEEGDAPEDDEGEDDEGGN